MPEKWVLRQYQSLPLTAKVHMSQARIREWYDHFGGDVVISFSGGKDSTVLTHVVHDLYPKVPLVFVNTGLEYPEIQAFARKMGAEFVRPKMQFSEVISNYGYPIISKENAEAIHYARMIRNGGGQATAERKRAELNGERLAGVNEASSMRGGGGNSKEETGTPRTASMYEGRTGWRRATLTGKPLSKMDYANNLAEAQRAFRRKRGEAGVAQTGTNGEDEPSPG